MRVHLVDGTFELFRAHFSPRMPAHRAPAGWDAKATVGLAVSLLALLHDAGEAVTHVAVAFDNPIRSFRNDLWPGYKSDEGVPPELRAQFDAAEDAAHALGLVVWSMDALEADDALATGALRFRGAAEQIRIVTPDKDLAQCVEGRRVVTVDRIRRRELDEEALAVRRGIRPASVPDWLALVGDAADGIPGLPGFGARTATRLLGAHGTIDAIPAHPADWPRAIRGAAVLARTLAEERGSVALWRRLATLVTDAPLAESLDDLRWRGIPRARFERWCGELDARALLPTLESRQARWADD